MTRITLIIWYGWFKSMKPDTSYWSNWLPVKYTFFWNVSSIGPWWAPRSLFLLTSWKYPDTHSLCIIIIGHCRWPATVRRAHIKCRNRFVCWDVHVHRNYATHKIYDLYLRFLDKQPIQITISAMRGEVRP